MMYVVTGGSASGKSEYAENLAVRLYWGRKTSLHNTRATDKHAGSKNIGSENARNGGKCIYVATMNPYIDGAKDEDMARRIRVHRMMRAEKGFETVECYTCIAQVQAGNRDVVLLECMSNLLANEMFAENGSLSKLCECSEAELYEMARQTIVRPILRLADTAKAVVIVTNEVFSDGYTERRICEQTMKRYIGLLGFLNRCLVKEALRFTEVVCGIPVHIKELSCSNH